MFTTTLKRFLAVLLFVAPVCALADTPAGVTADELMNQAKITAKHEHKDLLVIFSASWCGPCHMFERFLEDPTIAPIMEKNFVIVRLDDGEHKGDTKHANTPGGEALRAKLGGAKSGYPFIVMTNAVGEPIVTSMRPEKGKDASNIGYPSLPVEIDWFMQMLKEATPSLSSQETATIRSWLDKYGTH